MTFLRYLLLAGCLVFGCSSSDSGESSSNSGPSGDQTASIPPTTTAQQQAARVSGMDLNTLKALDSLGDRGTVQVVFDPRQWSEFTAGLTPIFTKLPGDMAAFFKSEAMSPEGLLSAGLVLPKETLTGWDVRRPSIASLFETVTDNRPGGFLMDGDVLTRPLPMPATETGGPETSDLDPEYFGPRTQPFRHTFMLPASDAERLAKSLDTHLKKGAEKRGDYWVQPRLFDGRDGSFLVETMSGFVRVTIVHPLDAMATSEEIGRALKAPRGSAQPYTPAYTALARSGSLARVHFRAWLVRRMSSQLGLNELSVAMMEPSLKFTERFRMGFSGFNMVAAVEQLFVAEKPDFDDHTLTFNANADGLTLQGVSSLSPSGAKILKSATTSTSRPLAVQKQVPGTLTINLNPEAFKNLSWRWLSGLEGIRAIEHSFQFAGDEALMFLGGRIPLTILSLLKDELDPKDEPLLGTLPTRLQVALIDGNPNRPMFAMALTTPDEFDENRLRKNMRPAQVLRVAQDRVLVGMDVDPRSIFNTDTASATSAGHVDQSQPLLEGRLDLTSMGPALAAMMSQMGGRSKGERPSGTLHSHPLMDVISLIKGLHVSLKADASGRALHSQVQITLKASTTVEHSVPTAESWPSPIRGYSQSLGDLCVSRALSAMSALYEALATPGLSTAERKDLLKRGHQLIVDDELVCMESHGETKALAKALKVQFSAKEHLVDLYYSGCRAKEVCIHSSSAQLHVGQAGTVTVENTAADLNPSAMQDVPGLATLLASERASKSKLIQLRHRRIQAMSADENTAQAPPLEVEEEELEDTEVRSRDDARSALAKSVEYLGPPPPRLEDAGQFHRTLTVLEDAHLTVGTLERIVATAQRADFRFFEFARERDQRAIFYPSTDFPRPSGTPPAAVPKDPSESDVLALHVHLTPSRIQILVDEALVPALRDDGRLKGRVLSIPNLPERRVDYRGNTLKSPYDYAALYTAAVRLKNAARRTKPGGLYSLKLSGASEVPAHALNRAAQSLRFLRCGSYHCAGPEESYESNERFLHSVSVLSASNELLPFITLVPGSVFLSVKATVDQQSAAEGGLNEAMAESDLVQKVENTGALKKLSANTMGNGAMQNVFGNTEEFDGQINAAMAEANGELVIGHGTGGMGLGRGGSGGGGQGFGRIHGMGRIDTGRSGRAQLGGRKSKSSRKKKARVRRGKGEFSGFCKESDILTVVKRQQRGIQFCYEKELARNPSLEGKVTMGWIIGTNGEAMRARVQNSSLGSKAVEGCIVRNINRWRFEKPEGGLCKIRIPFVFKSGL